MSPAIAAQLAAASPKFTPPESGVPKTAEPGPDARMPDKPRNGIVRLPPYLVKEPPIKLPNHRDILTHRGELALARKRYPGLNFGPLAFLNDFWAREMLEEDYRLERQREFNDLVSLLPAKTPNPALKRAGQELHFRPGDWVSTGGSFAAPESGLRPNERK